MSRHAMPFGAEFDKKLGTLFRLWAPGLREVVLELMPQDDDNAARHEMRALEGGWHELRWPDARPGMRYRFDVGNGLRVPDPASRFNPQDIHGASEIVDPLAYRWQDASWRGRPWHETVLYELHVGSFTAEGSYRAAAKRLPELAALGITAIELMPLADFPGQRGWGYDGVLQFAPDASYGPTEELKSFVDQAHGLGLMVLLDVVYNHFGPDGNYLHAYCPAFFNSDHQTPWGSAINFDGERHQAVRDFFRHNALYWIEEFHFDGLRMDAVHAILDDSPVHITREIAEALAAGPGRERQVHLVLENDANQARKLARRDDGSLAWATAQWDDDVHHAAHVLLTGERDGYYGDFSDALPKLARSLAEGFAYQGEASAHRQGCPHGEPSAHLPPTAFVSFLQNHDQIGNRAFGERLSAIADARKLDALYACLLLSPHIPMLFMGEEFAASTPFLYFCDFEAELAEAVAVGRRDEFARFAAFADGAKRASIPDPNAHDTFDQCVLRWDERESGAHQQRLLLIKTLLALRHRHLVPLLPSMVRGGEHRVDGGVLQIAWPVADGQAWHLAANLGDDVTQFALPPGQTIYASHECAQAVWPPYSVRVTRRQILEIDR